MTDITTELSEAVAQGQSLSDAWNELMRIELERCVNGLLQGELTALLDYDKWSVDGYNTGASRNGRYTRGIVTRFGKVTIEIPRDRNGEFQQHTVPRYRRNDGTLEDMVVQMYSKGITTSEIASLIEKMYGSYYTLATTLSRRYSVIYGDATYISVRRDTVSKEALHVLMGINDDGSKEILDYRPFPSESSENYREMLRDIHSRGVEEVLLFISDGLKELRNVFLEEYPQAQHQACWVHLMRSIGRNVRNRDWKDVLGDAKLIHQSKTKKDAQQQLDRFIAQYERKYPKAVNVLSGNPSLLTFYDYPEEIRRSIYTSNPIESFNKRFKSSIRKKEQFPNEDSLDRFTCVIASDYNKQLQSRQMKGFKKCAYERRQLFEERY